MPIFKPFRGIRPHMDFVEKFPTRPLDTLSPDEINKKIQEGETYANMIKPFIASRSKDVDRNLRKIRNNFEELLEQNKLIQDGACYYLYQQIMPDKRVYRGLLGLVSIEDFKNKKIKKHEATIKDRKEKLAHYLEKVNVQADPVLLTYKTNPKVELFMDKEEKTIPIINFTSETGTRHKLWRIDNRLKMQQIKEVLEQIDYFYIGDGHHRIGSAQMNADKLNEKNKKANGNEPYNFVYSYIVSKESIKIHDYNRLVKTLNGLSHQEFLQKLEKSFSIHEKGETPYFPSQKFHLSLYLGGKFYSIHVRHELRKEYKDSTDLDHFFLEKYIFNDILGIRIESESDNIDYSKGNSSIEGILALKEKVDSGEYEAAFGVYPISFNDLVKISDKEIKMPPKCTLIEPKLMSALVMYDTK